MNLPTENLSLESKPTARSGTGGVVDSGAWLGSVVRPSTYDQLIDNLKSGQACEVPDYMFRYVKGWTVAHSPRFGFVLFLPNSQADRPNV